MLDIRPTADNLTIISLTSPPEDVLDDFLLAGAVI